MEHQVVVRGAVAETGRTGLPDDQVTQVFADVPFEEVGSRVQREGSGSG